MAARSKSHTFVTREAITTEGFNKRDYLNFHYFNPNGAKSEKQRVNQFIRKLVDAGELPSGFILAYGTLDRFNEVRLSNARDNSKTTTTVEAELAVEALRKDTKTAKEEVAGYLGQTWEAIEARIGAEIDAKIAEEAAASEARQKALLAEFGL